MLDNSLLTIVSFMILASAIWVVIPWNPVISILNLIVLFGMVSFYLYLIGLSIMSLLYILIYIGAIAILFLFILSLLNVQYSELTSVSTMRDWPFIFIFSLLSLLSGYYYFNKNLISLYPFLLNQWSLNLNFFNLNFSLTYLTTWVNFFPINHLSLIGTLLYSKHAIFLFILAFILLLSIIGAIIITFCLSKN